MVAHIGKKKISLLKLKYLRDCPKWHYAVVRVVLRALAYRVSSSCHTLELGLRLSEQLR